MTDTFELTLNNPLTEEQWDMIADVDMERTDRITFHTKHGKEVEFAKVIRCKDCRYDHECKHEMIRKSKGGGVIYCPVEFCSEGERKEE